MNGGEPDGARVDGGAQGERGESRGESGRGGNQSRVTVCVGGPLVIAAAVSVAVVAASATISVAVPGVRYYGGD